MNYEKKNFKIFEQNFDISVIVPLASKAPAS